jgi:hypothetical protein
MLCRLTLLATLALFEAGCAIHPLPENVTGINTNNIAFHIRCEARDAAKNAAIAFLLNPNKHFSDHTRAAALALYDGSLKFENLPIAEFEDEAKLPLMKYQSATIAYDFTFDITEDNAAGGAVNFLSALTHGAFGLAANVGTDRQRQTIRNFRIGDTFEGLRTKLLGCDTSDVMVTGNHVYPIAGKVGLDEMLKTFVDLNEFENLTAPPSKASASADGDGMILAYAEAVPPPKAKKKKPAPTEAPEKPVPVLADTFNFVTLISGSVTPTLTIVPVHPNRFNLTSASIPLSSSRKDTHKLVVAMSLPNQKCAPAATLLTSPQVSTKGMSSEQCAFNEINNQKAINSFNNLLIVPR